MGVGILMDLVDMIHQKSDAHISSRTAAQYVAGETLMCSKIPRTGTDAAAVVQVTTHENFQRILSMFCD